MAVALLTSESFDFRLIDLASVLAGRSITLLEATGLQVTWGIGYTVGSQSGIIQGGPIFPDIHVRMDVAGEADFDFWGTAPETGNRLMRLDGAWYSGGDIISMAGLAVDADAFFLAADSLGTGDDQAIYRQVMRGNDLIRGSTVDDAFHLFLGDDVYLDQGGQDWVFCGAGDDMAIVGNVNGGPANDSLWGGAGNDLLLNSYGRGRLAGGTGDDTLIGVYGDDYMKGGAGADVFVFEADFGTHRVLDFDPLTDHIVLPEDVTLLADVAITQIATGARIAHGNWVLLLKGVDAADLTAGHFSLGGQTYSEAAQLAYLTGYTYDL
jgi:RTX calcium-binding nonapeptide repeat (4 copies)